MIIFFDIDGTLIGKGSQLMSDSTKAAISQARKNGHICVINTGRTRNLVVPEIAGQVEFDGLMLGCGTMVEYHGKELFHQSISMELSLRILEALKRYGIDAIMEGAELDYCDKPENMFTEVFSNYIRRVKRKYEQQIVFDIGKAPGKYDKFYAYVDDERKLGGFQSEFEAELDFIDREHGYYEVVPKGCSKAGAIRFLADKLQVPVSETVAIGDSNNDISMLEYAGISIAMGNSTKAVLEMADYVTTDVDRDGIWNALEWLGVLK